MDYKVKIPKQNRNPEYKSEVRLILEIYVIVNCIEQSINFLFCSHQFIKAFSDKLHNYLTCYKI